MDYRGIDIPDTHRLTRLEAKMLEVIQALLKVRYELKIDKRQFQGAKWMSQKQTG